MTPEWTVDISKAPVENTENLSLHPFHLGNFQGYFSDDGQIASCTQIPYRTTISSDYYALYSQDSQNIEVFDRYAQKAFTITGSGFPFIQEDRAYLFLPGGSSVAFIDKNGSWKNLFEYTSPITCFNSSEYGAVAGFADGVLCIFNSEGDAVITTEPGGSDFSVILGADISKTGKYFACVSGQEKQRFVLYRQEENHSKIIFHEFFDESLTRQTYVHFSEKEGMVYYNYKNGLGIVNTETGEAFHIPVKGKVLDIQESTVSDSVFVLSRNGSTYTVMILENFYSKVGTFSFNAESCFIQADTNMLFIGRDNKISRITLSRE